MYAENEADTNQERRDTEIAVDSGIDMQSIENIIGERVFATVDAKLEHIKNKATLNTNSSSEFTKNIYTKENEMNDSNITRMMSYRREQTQFRQHPIGESKSSHIQPTTPAPDRPEEDRKRNIIIHGLEEENESTDKKCIKEIWVLSYRFCHY